LFVVLTTCFDPFALWCIHDSQFLNHGFFAK
jgi:hypothetical protein